MAGFFPVFFKQYWGSTLESSQSTLQLGVANSVASLVIVFLAPVLGAIADRGSAKKKYLFIFALLGIVMTGALYFVQAGEWQAAVLLYVIATIGFSGSVLFSDSLIVNVTHEDKYDYVSALGYAFGYLGGGVIFALCVLMTQWPDYFGLSDSAEAIRLSFLLVAIWWLLFSIPVMLFVKEPEVVTKHAGLKVIKAGFIQLANTFQEIRRIRVVFLFLLGYWLYIDGVDTVVRMAIDYGLSIGFDSTHLIAALLITQFVGFPSAILFGLLGEKIGPKKGIQIAIVVYIGVVIWASTMDSVKEFYLLAVTIGLVQGGIQSLSRSMYARIIPVNKSAEFFGFYNMLGKFAAVIGPIMMGWVGVISGSPRIAILSVMILFVAGAIILHFVDVDEGRAMAREMEET
jgi:UMF1 family MFS transporter